MCHWKCMRDIYRQSKWQSQHCQCYNFDEFGMNSENYKLACGHRFDRCSLANLLNGKFGWGHCATGNVWIHFNRIGINFMAWQRVCGVVSGSDGFCTQSTENTLSNQRVKQKTENWLSKHTHTQRTTQETKYAALCGVGKFRLWLHVNIGRNTADDPKQQEIAFMPDII